MWTWQEVKEKKSEFNIRLNKWDDRREHENMKEKKT